MVSLMPITVFFLHHADHIRNSFDELLIKFDGTDPIFHVPRGLAAKHFQAACEAIAKFVVGILFCVLAPIIMTGILSFHCLLFIIDTFVFVLISLKGLPRHLLSGGCCNAGDREKSLLPTVNTPVKESPKTSPMSIQGVPEYQGPVSQHDTHSLHKPPLAQLTNISTEVTLTMPQPCAHTDGRSRVTDTRSVCESPPPYHETSAPQYARGSGFF